MAFISRSLFETEQRYAQVEKEALAVTWACERLSSYLIGLHFTIETDQKTLLALLGTKALEDLPPRIQRFRLRLLRYTYNIVHVPGKLLVTADALSRAPVVRELSSDKKGTGKRSTNVCGSGTSLLTNVIIKTTTNSRGAAIRQDLKGADGALQNGVAKTGGAKKIHKTLLGPSK